MRNSKKIAIRGILIALGLVISYFESFIMVINVVPGIKIGLANIVTIIALYELGVKETFYVSFGRIVIAGILFSGVTGIIYGLSGAIFSIAAMWLFKRIFKFGIMGVSIAGAVFHNVGQLLAALAFTRASNVVYYFAVLIIAGAVFGAVVGIIGAKVMKGLDFEFNSAE